jgi:hypothetical protein
MATDRFVRVFQILNPLLRAFSGACGEDQASKQKTAEKVKNVSDPRQLVCAHRLKSPHGVLLSVGRNVGYGEQRISEIRALLEIPTTAPHIVYLPSPVGLWLRDTVAEQEYNRWNGFCQSKNDMGS